MATNYAFCYFLTKPFYKPNHIILWINLLISFSLLHPDKFHLSFYPFLRLVLTFWNLHPFMTNAMRYFNYLINQPFMDVYLPFYPFFWLILTILSLHYFIAKVMRYFNQLINQPFMSNYFMPLNFIFFNHLMLMT